MMVRYDWYIGRSVLRKKTSKNIYLVITIENAAGMKNFYGSIKAKFYDINICILWAYIYVFFSPKRQTIKPKIFLLCKFYLIHLDLN